MLPASRIGRVALSRCFSPHPGRPCHKFVPNDSIALKIGVPMRKHVVDMVTFFQPEKKILLGVIPLFRIGKGKWMPGADNRVAI